MSRLERDELVDLERWTGRDELRYALEAPSLDRFGPFAGRLLMAGTLVPFAFRQELSARPGGLTIFGSCQQPPSRRWSARRHRSVVRARGPTAAYAIVGTVAAVREAVALEIGGPQENARCARRLVLD